MKKIIVAALMAGSVYTALNASQFDIGISATERGISGFYLSIGDYYHVPYNQIMVIERSIPRDELSVVYFLAAHSHMDARHIAGLRMRGLSWWDISIHLGLNPYTLFVLNSQRYPYPPYGVAHGYYKAGKKYRLRDAEVVDLVNVRFLSDYHHIGPDEVITRRRSGERFMNIDAYYRNQRMDRNRNLYHNNPQTPYYERNMERNLERNMEQRNMERNVERNVERNMEQRNMERNVERNVERNKQRDGNRNNDRGPGNSGRPDRGYER